MSGDGGIDLPTLVTRRREPSAQHTVYPLGIYEQMIVAKALLHTVMPDGGYDLTVDELLDLQSLLHLFEGHGMVTVIREEGF